MEEWRDIIDYKGYYQVSSTGRVKSLARVVKRKGKGDLPLRERILRLNNLRGYMAVYLCRGCKSEHFYAHRLVASAFIPFDGSRKYVNHKNGIKTDNKVSNLEWCTSSENFKHALKNKLIVQRKGESHHKAKLKKEDILKIRKMAAEGWEHQEIANLFNINKSHVSNIKTGRSWKHIK